MKPQPPPKPSVFDQVTQLLYNIDPSSRKVILGGLVVVFVLAGLTTLLLAYYVFEPQISDFFAAPTTTLVPTATPQCVRPTLTLGTGNYPLQVIDLTPQGDLPTPDGIAGRAWWVSNTFSPFVFLFTPTAGANLQTTLQPGDPLVVQWADCGREVFVLTNIQTGSPDARTLLAQSGPGIVAIIQQQGTTPGYVINGQRPELINPPTSEATLENAIMVDITFEGTGVSDDQQTLQTSLTITNRGANPLTITNHDLSLTSEGQTPLYPLNVQPSLPQEIQPEGSLSLTITFSNPGGNTAVLQVLDTTLDLYY